MLWVQKDWTLVQIHKKIFEVMGDFLMAEWVDYKDPDTTKTAGKKADLRQALCDFPYRPANWEEGKNFTREDYIKMPFDERFKMCFSGIM
jgi:hypothetical protein